MSKKELSINFRFPTELYPEPSRIILKALHLLPEEVKNYLIQNSIMFSAEYKDFRANAFCFSHYEFKDHKYLIHLQYHIWEYEEKKIIGIILHEIAHIYLGHRAEHVSYSAFSKEYVNQDREANNLVAGWLLRYREKGTTPKPEKEMKRRQRHERGRRGGS